MEDTNTERKLLAFCVNFPQDMNVELKQLFNQMLNTDITTVNTLCREYRTDQYLDVVEYTAFNFKEKPNSYEVLNTLRYIIDAFHRGRPQSIAYGVPHFGFDIIFIEVVREKDSVYIIDSYMIQNMFFTSVELIDDVIAAYVRGHYASNPKVAELAKTVLENNVQKAHEFKQQAENPPPVGMPVPPTDVNIH